MFDLFECPECGRIHDEPGEAAYVLAVRCLDCVLERDLFRFERGNAEPAQREVRTVELAPAA